MMIRKDALCRSLFGFLLILGISSCLGTGGTGGLSSPSGITTPPSVLVPPAASASGAGDGATAAAGSTNGSSDGRGDGVDGASITPGATQATPERPASMAELPAGDDCTCVLDRPAWCWYRENYTPPRELVAECEKHRRCEKYISDKERGIEVPFDEECDAIYQEVVAFGERIEEGRRQFERSQREEELRQRLLRTKVPAGFDSEAATDLLKQGSGTNIVPLPRR